jgi:hypothetical protein
MISSSLWNWLKEENSMIIYRIMISQKKKLASSSNRSLAELPTPTPTLSPIETSNPKTY